MDRLKLTLLITLLISFQQNTMAQTSYSAHDLNAIDRKINESIFINTNSNTFVTGETLHYKLYCLNNKDNTTSKYSKIAYVELIDMNKKSFFKHKLFLENGIGNGDFFIPTNLESGSYKLLGYTSWMLNETQPALFNVSIFVINPFQANQKNASAINPETKPESLPENPGNESNLISFDLSKKSFINREKVMVKLKSNANEPTQGNYSISVKKIDPLNSNDQLTSNKYTLSKRNANSPENKINIAGEFILPELRGEIISGRLISKTSQDNIENKTIALSIPGESYVFKISETDKNGKFIFNLEHPNSNPNIIIQLIDPAKQNYSIEIDKAKPINFNGLTFDNPLPLNPDLRKNIEERSIASQIENAYYNSKKDSLIATSKTKPFFDPLSVEYVLDDYTRFPSLKETSVEVLKEVYYKFIDNKYTLNLVSNDINNTLYVPSLILVDGLVIQDMNTLFEYNMDNIYKINVVKGAYYLGPNLFHGIISFTTKKFDYENNLKGNFIITPETIRPLSQKEYFQPDYTTNKNNRIPDFRHQLLWIPNIELTKAETDFSFFTSDINGVYEITLDGFTSKGTPVTVKETFEVK